MLSRHSLKFGLGLLGAWLVICQGAASLADEASPPADLSSWQVDPPDQPDPRRPQPAGVAGTALSSENWQFLLSPREYGDVELRAALTIEQPATQFRFFGRSWSVWPDPLFGDQGFEAGLLLAAQRRSTHPPEYGYRVQLSHKYQQLALVKYPDGGFVRSVPCAVQLGQPHRVAIRRRGDLLTVQVDGEQKLAFRDALLPLGSGRLGVGASSKAVVRFQDVAAIELPPDESSPAAQPAGEHRPEFSARKWLGDRTWVFDGDEPILLLPAPESSYINCVKLRPGYKPQLSWNSHWDVQNQGAYKEAANETIDVQTSGGGATLTATWRGRHLEERFGTATTLTIGYDARRQCYTYDIDSDLQVFAAGPFHFRYGYDFEHHTPLDPFQWQYLLARRSDGQWYHRPVYPIDPGPQLDLAQDGGARVWYGRHNEPLLVAPAVEYAIPEPGQRKLNTAVCAAFYDTGVSFAPETAEPGTRVYVKYRYTGYPADEAERLFRQSKIYDSPMLDPEHHYVFAEWPKQSFGQFLPMSSTWLHGRRPFMTGHNRRPTYEVATDDIPGSGTAMKLPPLGYGKAALPMPEPLAAGRYVISGLCRSDNAHGTGGRIELHAVNAAGQPLLEAVHYVGAGSFDWRTIGFVFELAEAAKTLTLGLGNGGTGDVYFTDVEIRPLPADASPPPGAESAPRSEAPRNPRPAPAGAVADYRMEEGRGYWVLNQAEQGLPPLELANAAWTVDEGRPALRFAPNPDRRQDYARGGALALQVFSHPGNQAGRTASFALAGHHGGGRQYEQFAIAAWVKPGPTMQPAHWGSDILGFGARRVKLVLKGEQPPYRLGVSLNFGDFIPAEPLLEADRWYHLAVVGETSSDNRWRIRHYVDGRPAGEGVSEKVAAPMLMPPSLIAGCELFYLNNAYYHGLLGRTLVFDRALSAEEVETLSKE